MGLDYSYNIYIRKENLKRTLKFLQEHSCPERTSFKIMEDQLFHINRYFDGKETKTLLDNFGINQETDTTILVDEDDSIIEYHLLDLTHNYSVNSEEESDFIDYYKRKDNKWWIGVVQIYINDYSGVIEDIVEIKFYAVSSQMSRLFAKSKSIDKYFKELCKAVEAEYACIYMEEEGYRLIWAKGKEYNLTVPVDWSNFQEFGFVRVISSILKI